MAEWSISSPAQPILAPVVTIIMALTNAVGCMPRPIAQRPDIMPPLVVNASYGGAGARVAAETVTAGLEQQISDVEDMPSMSPVSDDDDASCVTSTFKAGDSVEIATAAVLLSLLWAQTLKPVPGRFPNFINMMACWLHRARLRRPDGVSVCAHRGFYRSIAGLRP